MRPVSKKAIAMCTTWSHVVGLGGGFLAWRPRAGPPLVEGRPQLGWIPACLTTAIHLVVSERMKSPSSSGVLPTVKAPISS